MGNFHSIVTIIGTLIIAVSFSTAFVLRKNKETPPYLQYFYIYPLFTLLVSLNSIVFTLVDSYRELLLAVKIEKFIVVVDFIFWGIFFVALFKNSNSKNIKLIVTVTFISTLIFVLISNWLTGHAYNGLGYANLGKCLFCIVYFFSIFRSPPNLNLRDEPVFWITTGLLFYSAISTPAYLSLSLFFANKYMDLISILFPLTNISIIVMHLLFIKGYLCKIQPPKTF